MLAPRLRLQTQLNEHEAKWLAEACGFGVLGLGFPSILLKNPTKICNIILSSDVNIGDDDHVLWGVLGQILGLGFKV